MSMLEKNVQMMRKRLLSDSVFVFLKSLNQINEIKNVYILQRI